MANGRNYAFRRRRGVRAWGKKVRRTEGDLLDVPPYGGDDAHLHVAMIIDVEITEAQSTPAHVTCTNR